MQSTLQSVTKKPSLQPQQWLCLLWHSCNACAVGTESGLQVSVLCPDMCFGECGLDNGSFHHTLVRWHVIRSLSDLLIRSPAPTLPGARLIHTHTLNCLSSFIRTHWSLHGLPGLLMPRASQAVHAPHARDAEDKMQLCANEEALNADSRNPEFYNQGLCAQYPTGCRDRDRDAPLPARYRLQACYPCRAHKPTFMHIYSSHNP